MEALGNTEAPCGFGSKMGVTPHFPIIVTDFDMFRREFLKTFKCHYDLNVGGDGPTFT